MSTEFYLQTRGKTIDYRFLYQAPSTEWWRDDYAEYTLFEDKTIILERLIGGECRLYLSGIPSKRRDRVNTIIRYTLVAKIGKGESSENFRLVKQFLDDCRNKSNALGERLDSDFLEQYIEDALRSDGECQNPISQKIASLVNSIPYSEPGDQDEEGIWWGGLASDNSCKIWLSLAGRILKDGEFGVAALLNATSEKSLPSLKEKLQDKGIENSFILLPDNNSEPKSIQEPRKDEREMIISRIGNMTEGMRKSWPYFSTKASKVYLGAGVLFSAFIFLAFILAR